MTKHYSIDLIEDQNAPQETITTKAALLERLSQLIDDDVEFSVYAIEPEQPMVVIVFDSEDKYVATLRAEYRSEANDVADEWTADGYRAEIHERAVVTEDDSNVIKLTPETV
tara:strand:- start:7170 stop:7505 length:336 start_codon:yes stop_codon:yes gene_type:complete